MEKIFKGMDNAPDAINGNFNELSDPKRDVTVNDLTISGRINGNGTVKSIKIGKLNATISRFGTQVFLSIPTQDWPYDRGAQWSLAFDMVVPIGYRPVGKVQLPMMNRFTTSFMQLNTDGTMLFSTEPVDNSTGFELSGNWSTNDSWPE